MNKTKIYFISLILFMLIAPAIAFSQLVPEFSVSGGTVFFTNSTRYSRNYNTSFSLNIPVTKQFIIQPVYSTGSYRGYNELNSFTASVDLTQLSIGYRLFLPKVWNSQNCLQFKLGLGVIKSNVLSYSNLKKEFNLIQYPFFTYYTGMEYEIYSKNNFGLDTRIDYYITQTKWLDGNEKGGYDNYVNIGVGVIYKLGHSSSEKSRTVHPIEKYSFADSSKKIELASLDSSLSSLRRLTMEMEASIKKSIDSSRALLSNQISRPKSDLQEKMQNDTITIKDEDLSKDSIFKYVRPDKTVGTIVIKPAQNRFSIICGGYKNLDNAVNFAYALEKKGISCKVILKRLGSNTFMVSLYDGESYKDASSKLKQLYPRFEKLEIKGRLWIWDKKSGY